MNDTVDNAVLYRNLAKLSEGDYTPSQARELLITLGYFNKNLYTDVCDKKKQAAYKELVKIYFKNRSILKIIIVGDLHTHEIEIISYCKSKFSIDEDIIEFMHQGSIRPELLNLENSVIIFADVTSSNFRYISKFLLANEITFSETKTRDGDAKRKLTLRTLDRSIHELYFQRK